MEHKAELDERMVARMLQGDERCKFAIGMQVEKVNSEEEDHMPNGTHGVVVGSLFLPDEALPSFLHAQNESYLVMWHGLDRPTFVIGSKLTSSSQIGTVYEKEGDNFSQMEQTELARFVPTEAEAMAIAKCLTPDSEFEVGDILIACLRNRGIRPRGNDEVPIIRADWSGKELVLYQLT